MQVALPLDGRYLAAAGFCRREIAVRTDLPHRNARHGFRSRGPLGSEDIQFCQRGKFQLQKLAFDLFGKGQGQRPRVFAYLDGNIAVDGGELIRKVRRLLPRFQFFTYGSGTVAKVSIYAVKASKTPDKIERRLLADAGDAGDIVGTIAHQRLHVDDLTGLIADQLFKMRGIQLQKFTDARLGEIDGGALVHQLIGVAVAGDDDAVRIRKAVRKRTHEVVRLVAFLFAYADAHGAEQFFQHPHLHGEIVGHRLARRLIPVVQLMAEGRRLQVEGHDQLVRILVGNDLQKQLDKAEYRVGRRSVFGRQQPGRVIGAVQKAVAVDQDQCLHKNAHPRLVT